MERMENERKESMGKKLRRKYIKSLLAQTNDSQINNTSNSSCNSYYFFPQGIIGKDLQDISYVSILESNYLS